MHFVDVSSLYERHTEAELREQPMKPVMTVIIASSPHSRGDSGRASTLEVKAMT